MRGLTPGLDLEGPPLEAAAALHPRYGCRNERCTLEVRGALLVLNLRKTVNGIRYRRFKKPSINYHFIDFLP